MSDLKGISMKCEPPGPEAQKIMDRDKRFMATTNKVMPVVAKRGKGMYVEDVDGNVYLAHLLRLDGTGFGVIENQPEHHK